MALHAEGGSSALTLPGMDPMESEITTQKNARPQNEIKPIWFIHRVQVEPGIDACGLFCLTEHPMEFLQLDHAVKHGLHPVELVRYEFREYSRSFGGGKGYITCVAWFADYMLTMDAMSSVSEKFPHHRATWTHLVISAGPWGASWDPNAYKRILRPDPRLARTNIHRPNTDLKIGVSEWDNLISDPTFDLSTNDDLEFWIRRFGFHNWDHEEYRINPHFATFDGEPDRDIERIWQSVLSCICWDCDAILSSLWVKALIDIARDVFCSENGLLCDDSSIDEDQCKLPFSDVCSEIPSA